MPKVSQVQERSVTTQPLQTPNMNLGTQQYQAFSGLGKTIQGVAKQAGDALHAQKMQDINQNNQSTLRNARANIQNAVTSLTDDYRNLRGENAVNSKSVFYKSINNVVKEEMKKLNGWQREQLQVNADAIGREGIRAIDRHHIAQTRVFDNETTERDIEAIKSTAVANPTPSNVLVQGMKLVDTWTAKYMREGLGAENATKRASAELSGMVTDMMISAVQENENGGLTQATQIQDAMQAVEDAMNTSRVLNGQDVITVWQPDDKKRFNNVKKAYNNSAFASEAVDKAYDPTKSYEENLSAVNNATKNKDQKIKDEAVRRLELKIKQQERIEREAKEATLEEIVGRLQSGDITEAMTLSQLEYKYPDMKFTKGELQYLQQVEAEVMAGVIPETNQRAYPMIQDLMFTKGAMEAVEDPKLFARFLNKEQYAEFEEHWRIHKGIQQPKEELVKTTNRIVGVISDMMQFDEPIDKRGEITTDKDKAVADKNQEGIMKVHSQLNYIARQYKQVHGTAPSDDELFRLAKESGMMEKVLVGVDDRFDFATGLRDENIYVTALDILSGQESMIDDPDYEKAKNMVEKQVRDNNMIVSSETINRMTLEQFIAMRAVNE